MEGAQGVGKVAETACRIQPLEHGGGMGRGGSYRDSMPLLQALEHQCFAGPLQESISVRKTNFYLFCP